MDMKENNNKKDLLFDKVLKMNGKYYYYDHDKDKEDIEEHGVFKIYLIALGVILIVATIINFNYLGGIEGILTAKMLPIEGTRNYIAAVGSLFLMPILSAIFLWLAFRKNKKRH